MKCLLSIFMLFPLIATAAAVADSARTSFDAGLTAFSASNYPVASNAFSEAAAAAPAEKLDPAAAHYNAALAAYAAGDLKAAADLFARAAIGSDLGLQAKAYYNRGNALFHQVGNPAAGALAGMPLPAMSTQELAAAEASICEAIQMYENAIALDPRDADAKANYELAVLKQQELEQQQQQQQQNQQQDPQKEDQQNQEQQNQEGQNDQQKQEQEPQEQPQQSKPEQPPEAQPADPQTNQEQQIKEDKPSEEMTPEEAAMMLDALKAQEQSQRDRLHPLFGRPVPVEKDW